MKIGDLVTHDPCSSFLTNILTKLDGLNDPSPEFLLGVIVEKKGPRSRVFSYQLTDNLSWFDNDELKDID